jgi:hypothetical protein
MCPRHREGSQQDRTWGIGGTDSHHLYIEDSPNRFHPKLNPEKHSGKSQFTPTGPPEWNASSPNSVVFFRRFLLLFLGLSLC